MAFDITPNGITFSPPVTLKFTYYNLPAGMDPSTLQIAYYDTTQNAWVVVPSTVDATTNTISAQISHFTTYAVTYGVKPSASTTTTSATSTSTATPGTTTTTVITPPMTTTAAMVPLTTTSATTSPASTSPRVTTSVDNTGINQTAPTSSTATLETNLSIITPAIGDTTTPTAPVTVRMYILAVVIGVAVFLITFTVIFIWLRHRDLVKKDGHLN